MKTEELKHLLVRAYRFRDHVRQETEIYRAFAGKGDGIEGLIIDVLGQIVWVRVLFPCEKELLENLYSQCQELFTQQTVYLHHRKSENFWILPETLGNTDLTCTAKEGGTSFEVRNKHLDDFGIFADSRGARNWLQPNTVNCKVLNLFAYTCGFGVVAARSGAAEVINIDVSKEFLSWGKRNAAINNVNFSVIPEDCLKYLHRLHNRIKHKLTRRPDIIVLDPPAFLAGRGARRVTRNLWPEYLQAAAQILEPGGSILISCNDSYMLKKNEFVHILEEDLKRAGARPELRLLEQTSDVIGQEALQDQYYLPPQFWTVRL